MEHTFDTMRDVRRPPRIACFATQGSGSLDEARIAALLEELSPEVLPFNRGTKRQSGAALAASLRRLRPDLVVMEGTGIAGGAALITARATLSLPYVVSSGDAVAPFWGLQRSSLRIPGLAYERALFGLCAGFIGWTPYLVGRALTLGAPRAMTASSWSQPAASERRDEIRARLCVPANTLTFGIVGSIRWNESVQYCYGLELIQALQRVKRRDVVVVIVGDGDGLPHIRSAAEDDERVILTGRVPHEDVPAYLAAIDVASLPQSVDGIGSFRYTTKLSEYLAAGLPTVTSRVPFSYDLDDGWLWRLPGAAPWDATYVSALSQLMEGIRHDEVSRRRERVPRELAIFDKRRQQRRAAEFISELLDDGQWAPP